MKPMAILLAIVSGIAFAQVQTEESKSILRQIQTYSFFNGRSWNADTPTEKVQYLTGFMEGLSKATTETTKQYDFGELSIAEVRAGIDRFYAEPENILIRIVDALQVFAMKLNGVPQARIDVQVSVFRKAASQAPERRTK
jgi:hypothetical protein